MAAFRHIAASILALCATAAWSSETITYSYDPRGRLTKVVHSGTVNNGATACYGYDKADNRSNVTVATSSDCAVPVVTFSISSNGAVVEGASSVFTVTKTGTSSTSLSVNYASANGTAVAPGDYTAKSGTLTFAAGPTSSQTVSVTTIDDTVVESPETFTMALSGATGGATIGTATATATINDNDGGGGGACAGVSYTVNDVSTVEGSPLVFTVSKAGTTTSSCSVNYATADGTATTPTHYVATSGTLTFTSTQTSKTVSVTTIDNSRLNATLKMYLNLSSPTSGATIADSQGQGSITASGGGCLTCLQSTGPGATEQLIEEPSVEQPPPPPPE